MSINVVTSAGKMKGKILSIILSVLLAATLFTVIPPAEAYAAGEVYVINVAEPGNGDDTWGFAENTITVNDLSEELEAAKDAYHPLEITGKSDANKVVFADRTELLDNALNVTLSALALSSESVTSLFSIGDNWKTNLILAGEGKSSISDTTTDGVGLSIGADSTVTIGGSGILEVVGDDANSGYGIEGVLAINGDVIVDASGTDENVTLAKGIFADFDAGGGPTPTIEIAGDVTLPGDYVIIDDFASGLTIGDDASLTIPEDVTLTIEDGAELIVDEGGLNVAGEIINNGTLTITTGSAIVAAGGEITNNGILDVDGGSVIVNGSITNTGSVNIKVDEFTNNGVITNGNGSDEATFEIGEGNTVTNAASASFVNTTGSAVTIGGTLATAGDITNYGTLEINKAQGSISGVGTVYNYGKIANKGKIDANYEGMGDLSVTSDSDTIAEHSWDDVESPLALADKDTVELKGNSPSAAFVIQPANSGSATIIGKAGQAYANITIATASGNTSDVELTIEDLHLSDDLMGNIIDYSNGGS
ncbi:MAG: hypothetical protein LBL54_01380, partial [Clostridiales Family XIII bacterium]|nr:hypothetical protein [Clostridiales Family XIII bacterium]